MDKRSPKSPVLYERYKSGRAWRVIHLFHFDQGQSNRRRGLNSQTSDDRRIKSRLDLLSNIDGTCQCIYDEVNKNSLMIDYAKVDGIETREGDKARELQAKMKIANTRGQQLLNDVRSVGNLTTNHKRKASKTFQKYGCKDISTIGHRRHSYQNSLNKSSQKFNSEAMNETSCNQAHPKDCSCRSVSHQKYSQLGEVNLQAKMNEAAEAFINQKFIKGKYFGKNMACHKSKHFLDALEILNSNKELFIKLLQDPNSLLVKHIQDLRHSQANKQEIKSSSEAKLTENRRTTVRESVDPQTSERIVVLKASSTTMQNCAENTTDCSFPQYLYSLRNRVQSTKPAYFSFDHMQRKLRRAIGLSRNENKSPPDLQGLGDGSKGKAREIAESNSLSKYNLVSGEMEKHSSVKRRDELRKVKESEPGINQQVALCGGTGHINSKLSIVRHFKQSESNMYLESRTCLSEVSRNRNEDFSRKHVPANSERIACQPDYDLLSALSLGRNWDGDFSAAQMRFSPCSYYQIVKEKKQKLRREKQNGYTTDQLQIFDTRPNTSENLCTDIRSHENVCSVTSTSSSGGSVKTVEPCTSEESNGVHNNGEKHSTCLIYTYEYKRNLECSKLDSPMENCTSSSSEDVYSSNPLSSKRLEDSDIMNDKPEQSSSVSVLEQFFLEDVTSPLSTVSQSAEPKQDKHEKHYSSGLVTSPEDMKINSSNVIDEHGSMSQNIMAVLQASVIKWEELPMTFHLSDQILEPSFLHELEFLLPNRFSDDRKLLFDYINEILIEVYQCNFSSSPWVSFLRPKFQPVQSVTNVANDVMKYVDWYLLSQHPSPTLDQLVHKDLAKSRAWMDILNDSEHAVTELVESVLEELTLEMSTDLQI